MQFARRVAKLTPSATLAVSAKAKALQAKGVDVIDFSAGEPDFETPDFAKDAAIQALRDGWTRYTPVAGLPSLRQAVAKFYQERYGLTYAANQVVITCGAKHALYNIFQILLDPGDEAIVPAPYWVSYPDMVWLAEADAVILPTTEATGFKITAAQLRAACTPRTKMLILNSPSNPTGAAYTRDELAALAQVALEKNLWVIADEIYEHLVYDGFRAVSFPTLDPALPARTIVVSGASKTFAMTGWRIGWAVGPADVVEMLQRLQSQSTSNITTFAQVGAVAALQAPPDWIEAMRREFEARRNFAVARLNEMPGVTCCNPEGAFYVFPRVDSFYGKRAGDKVVAGSLAMCDYLLDRARIAVVPGIGFGADEYIRLSYATSLAQIEAGLKRLAEALGELQ